MNQTNTLGTAPPIRARAFMRVLIGSFFAVSGVAKLIASPLEGIPPGLRGFSDYLDAAGVPFPLAGAVIVCAVEIVCGLGLALGGHWLPARALTSWFALPLALEMAVAMTLVGIPAALGDPVVLNGTPVTKEPYRLPLELGLFLGVCYLAWRWHLERMRGAKTDTT